MPRILILGTGTGVGKTHVTAALARALAAADRRADVIALKPIETGVSRAMNGTPPARSDAGVLEAASRGPVVRPHPLYVFPEPISAHLAARHIGARISLRALAHWLDSTTLPDTTSRVTWLLLETAGGAFSPLGPRSTNADLRRVVRPDVTLLIAPDSLGVLHDVRATLKALGPRRIDHLVLSGARPADASTGTNAAELVRVGLPRPIAIVSRDAPAERALAPLVRALRRALPRRSR